jgi:hypothetical protein
VSLLLGRYCWNWKRYLLQFLTGCSTKRIPGYLIAQSPPIPYYYIPAPTDGLGMLNRFFFGGVQAWIWGAGGIPRFRIPSIGDPGATHSILREVLLGMGGTRRPPVVSTYEAPAQKHDEHRDHANPYVVRKLKLPHSPKFYPKEAAIPRFPAPPPK